MWLVLKALRRPATVLVAVIAILLSAGLAVRTAPVDIFPDLGVPVIYVRNAHEAEDVFQATFLVLVSPSPAGRPTAGT